MRKSIGFLAATVLSLSASAGLNAFDFTLNAADISTVVTVPESLPVPAAGGNKWWSVLSSAHKAIATAALKTVDGGAFPDIVRFSAILIKNSSNETGHPDPSANGGKVKEIWFGTAPEKEGGVLPNYEQFKFELAYLKLGIICHLTQDQSVPTHAANVNHYTNDSFEGYSVDGNKVEIKAISDAKGNPLFSDALEPYEYYQAVQDDTRRNLDSWVNPANGKPYWLPAPGAPPLGEDATYGPWGKYGAGGDYAARPAYSSEGGDNSLVSASPEIRTRQLSVAGLATVKVLMAASKKLPPLVSGLTLSASAVSAEEELVMSFTAIDNRSRKVSFKVFIYKDGERLGAIKGGDVALEQKEMFSADSTVLLKIGAFAPGTYMLDLRLTDEDGNTTPDEVNSDALRQNNTIATLTVN